jgi:hypothetical protein
MRGDAGKEACGNEEGEELEAGGRGRLALGEEMPTEEVVVGEATKGDEGERVEAKMQEGLRIGGPAYDLSRQQGGHLVAERRREGLV